MPEVEFSDPKHIAAGAFHTFVVLVPCRDDDDADEQKDDESGCTVFAWGSNRNNTYQDVLVENPKDVMTKGAKPQKTSSDDPKQLPFFTGKHIFEVSCGGNHTMVLEKKDSGEESKLWALGLGIGGRLGVKRPESDGQADAILKDSQALAPLPGGEYEPYSSAKKKLIPIEFWNQKKIPKWRSPAPLLVHIPGGFNVVRVACGIDHTLALLGHGGVLAWGCGGFGNLGLGHTNDVFEPTDIPYFQKIPCRMIAAGAKHSMAIDIADGNMYSWGHGGNGRLGHGESDEGTFHDSFEGLFEPKVIEMNRPEPFFRIRYISCGEAHSAAIDNSDNAYTWGCGSHGRTGHGEESDIPRPARLETLAGTPVKQIELGTFHSMVLTYAGNIWAWGTGQATGLLEAGSKEVYATPQMLAKYQNEKSADRILAMDFLQIACGPFHTVAMQNNGTIYTWGSGAEGRLGLGLCCDAYDWDRMSDQSLPVPVEIKVKEENWKLGFSDKKRIAVAKAAGDHLAHQDGETKENEREKEKTKVTSIFCGGMSSACLVGPKDEQKFWSWGSGEFGQTGFNTTQDQTMPRLLDIKEVRDAHQVEEVALGLSHVLVRTSHAQAASVFVWGSNHCGQLGFGDTVDVHEPRRLLAVGRSETRQVAAGEDHSAALTENGELYTWGSFEHGKLGHGSSDVSGTQNFPRRVRTLEQWKFVKCGAQHTGCINIKDKAFTFGAGWYGRLGHGDMGNKHAPEQVMELDGMMTLDIQCGSYHTCFIVADESDDLDTDKGPRYGRLWCCGRDKAVCESDHTTIPKSRICSELKVMAGSIACGPMHTILLDMDQQLWGWGENDKGQLDAWYSSEDQLNPIRQPDMLQVEWVNDHNEMGRYIVKVATGVSHSLALTNFGEVYAWGCAWSGRLGIKKDKKDDKDDRTKAYGGRTKVCEKPSEVDPAWKDEDDKVSDLQTVLAEKFFNHYKGDLDKIAKALTERGLGSMDADLLKKDGGPRNAKAFSQKLFLGFYTSKKELPARLQQCCHVEHHKHLEGEDAAAEDGEKEVHTGGDYEVLQRRLQNEKEENRPDKLAEMEDQLMEEYEGIMSHIQHLWSPPTAKPGSDEAKYNEYNLRMLEERFEKSVVLNLTRMHLDEPYPQLHASVHWNIATTLGDYEEMMWVLQQQPCYLGALAKALKHERPTYGSEAHLKVGKNLWFDTVTMLYQRVQDDRTRHLFMALIRFLIQDELAEFNLYAEKHKSAGMDALVLQLFNPANSKVCELMSWWTKDNHFNKLHKVIFDVGESSEKEKKGDKDKKESLMGIIVEYCLATQPDEKSTGAQRGRSAQAQQPGGGAQREEQQEPLRFCFDVHEMVEIAKERKRERGNVVDDTEGTDASAFAAHHVAVQRQFDCFKSFIRQSSLDLDDQPDSPGIRQHHDEKRTFSTWLTDLKLDDESQWGGDLKSIFSKIHKTQRVTMNSTKAMRDEDSADFWTPSINLFLHSVLAPICEAWEHLASVAVKNNLMDKIRKIYPEKNFPDKDSYQQRLDEAFKVVGYNIVALGRFLKKAATDDFGEESSKELKDLGMGKDAKKRNLDFFQNNKMKLAEDETVTELMLDLYRSHYNLHLNTIMTPTVLLLQLSNALWLNLNEIIQRSPAGYRKDILFCLLDRIHPKDPNKEDRPGEYVRDYCETRLWTQDMLAIAEQQKVYHNFTIRHRFLEYHESVTFCRGCQAPIIFKMAKEGEGGAGGRKLMKVYKPHEDAATVKAFEDLVAVFRNKDLPMMQQRGWQNFLSLKSEFDDATKTIHDKLQRSGNTNAPKEFALMHDIDKAKAVATELARSGAKKTVDFQSYVFKELEAREGHKKYLAKADELQAKVTSSKNEYLKKIKRKIEVLEAVALASTTVSVPEVFKMRAEEQNETLRFHAVQRMMLKDSKDDSGINKLPAMLPYGKFSLANLRAKQVVAWMHKNLKQKEYENIDFYFHGAKDGAWRVEIAHTEASKTHVLFDFHITRAEIDRMRGAGKMAKRHFRETEQGSWVVMNAFQLVQLLARITARSQL